MIFQSQINKIEREIAGLEFELKLKNNVDKKCARFNYHIVVAKEKLETIKSLADEVEKVIDEEEQIYFSNFGRSIITDFCKHFKSKLSEVEVKNEN